MAETKPMKTDDAEVKKALEAEKTDAGPVVTSTGPSPTQAELDAIREGHVNPGKRKREAKAEASVTYKTR